MSNTDCWIVDAVRTPTGKRNGSLSGYHPSELGAHVVDSLFDRLGLKPDEVPVDDLFLGCVSQVGAQSGNLARGVVLASSLPPTVPGMTLDRQCGSSLQALQLATHQVWATGGSVLAGGVEIMSAVPLGSGYDFGVTSALVSPKPKPPRPAPALAPKPTAATAPAAPKPHSASALVGPSSLARFPLGTPLPASVMLRYPAPCPSGLPKLPLLTHAHPFSIAALHPDSEHAEDALPADANITVSTSTSASPTAWFYSYSRENPYNYLPDGASLALLPPAHAYSASPHPGPCRGPHHLPPAPAHSQFVGADVIARKYGLCHCALLEYARLSFHRAILAQRRGACDTELAPIPKRSQAALRAPEQGAADPAAIAYGPDAPRPAACRQGPYGLCSCSYCATNINNNTSASASVSASASASASASTSTSSELLLADETTRPVPSQAKLLSLRPIAPSTWITAPLASQISDGASMALLVSTPVLNKLMLAARRPIRPLARVVATCAVAGDPVCMLDQVPVSIARVVAMANERLAREHADKGLVYTPLTPGDERIYYEINEAFAPVPLVAARVLGIRPERLNVWGGAIALGHPLGATGAKLVATACRAARKLGCAYAVVSVCEGGGMANAFMVEVQDAEMTAAL